MNLQPRAIVWVVLACLLSLDVTAKPAVTAARETPSGAVIASPRHRADFSARGVAFTPTNGPKWEWSLERVTLGGRPLPLARRVRPAVSPDGDRVIYDRRAVIEQYVSKAATVEQQFIINEHLGDGDLVFDGVVRSRGRFTATTRGWTWRDRAGAVSLGRVTVFDARGRTLAARMEAGPKSTRIIVDGAALRTAAYPVTVDPEIGAQDFRVTTMGTDGNTTATTLHPSIAYNSVNDEYLVVFQGADDLGESEIWARRVDADGTLLGSLIRVSTMGSTSNVCCGAPGPYFYANTPDVAYNATRNEYLIVWRGNDDTSPSISSDYEIFGQRLNAATGAEVGADDFRISQMGPDAANGYFADTPNVAWDSVNDKYLVVYHGSEDDAGLVEGELEVWGRLVNGDGTILSSDEIRISSASPDGTYFRSAFAAAVAYDSINKQYLVVWSSDGEPASDNENEVWGQRVTAAGALTGSNIRVSDMGVNGSTESQAQNPAVAFNSNAGEFLVVWNGDDTVPGDNEVEVFGQRITASTGAEVGTNDFRISEMGPEGNTGYAGNTPAVAYDPVNQQYLVIWMGADVVQYDVEVWAQRLSATGAAVGRSDYKLTEVGPEGTSTTYQAGDGDVAAGGSGKMFIVWRANDETFSTSMETELFGQLFQMQNAAPAITVPGTTSYTENASAVTISPTATITDDSEDFHTGTLTVQFTANGSSDDRLAISDEGTGAGQIGVSGSDVSYSGTVIGTSTGGTGTTPLVITFDDDATPAAVQALAQHITFSNVSDDPSTSARTVQFAINDGDGQSASITKSISVTPVADSPSITLPGSAVSYVRSSAATVLDSTAVVTDPDATIWSAGTLTVNFTANGQSDDRLEVRHEGVSSGQIGVSGSNVSYGGVTIGTYAGGTGTTALVISFNASASLAAAQAVARNITYRNVSSTASLASRTVQFVFTISGLAGSAATKTINLSAANTNPAITLPGGALNWSEDTAAVIIDANATVTDAESTDFSGGAMTVSYTAGGTSDDRLSIQNQGTAAGQIGVSGSNVTYGGTIIGTHSGGTGTTALTIAFNASSSPAAAQALARNITFLNVAAEPPASSRTVQFAVTDGDGGSGTATTTIHVVALNDAPIVTLSGGSTSYTELDPAIVLDATATVSDSDSSDFDGGTLTVDYSANGSADDMLAIRSAGNVGVSGSIVSVSGTAVCTFTGGSGTTPLVVTLNASATADAVQAIVRNVTYRNTSEAPSTLQRTVRFVITDGDGGTSNAATKNVTVSGISTAPTVTLSAGTITYVENAAPTIVDDAATVTDPDSGDFNNGAVVVTLTANGTADDRLAIATAGPIVVTNDQITYSGSLIGTFTGGSGTTPLTITLTGSATAARTEALLRNITFANISDAPSPLTRTVQFAVGDGDGGSSTPQARTIDLTLTNDAPAIVLGASSPSFTEGGAAVIVAPNATVTDLDLADFDGGTLAVDLNENGSSDDRLLVRHEGTAAAQVGVSGTTITYGGTAIGTLAGGTGTTPLVATFNASATAAVVQAVARNVTFSNVSDTPSVAGRSIRFVVTDGDGGTSGPGTTAAEVTATNDVPVVTLPGGTVVYSEGSAAIIIDGAATVSDADSADFASGSLTASLTNASTDDRLQIRNEGSASGQIGTSGSQVAYGGIAFGTFSGGSGTSPLTVTFNAAATVAAAQALARNIAFLNVSSTPSTVARTVSIVVDDGDGGTSTAATKTINVVADACATTTAQYRVTAESSATVGVASTVTIEPLDAANAAVPCYTGTVHFTSSDAAATLPADYTFSGSESSHSFEVTLRTVGTQTVTAIDTVTSSIGLTWSVTVKAATTTTLSSSPNPSIQGESVTLTATVASSTSGSISGTVTFADGATTLGTAPLSGGTATLTTTALSAGTRSLTATYSGDSSFLGSTSSVTSHTVTTTASGPPAIVIATATSTSSITINWTAVSGATTYEVFRSELNGPYVLVGTTSGLSMTNSGLTAGRTYLYKVRLTGGASFSSIDAATTIIFSASTLTSQVTKIQTAHITELRNAVNAMRAAAGLGAATFADDPLATGTGIRAVHITDLRTALNAARSTLGLSTISYTDATLTAGQTAVKAAHVAELRSGTQ